MKIDITKFNACTQAVSWFNKFESEEEAWENCHRGDWMLWIAFKLEVAIHILTLAKGLCAETVIHLMTDQRSIDAVHGAIAFGRGKIDKERLKKLADAAARAACVTYDTKDCAEAAYAAYKAASIHASFEDTASVASSAVCAISSDLTVQKETQMKTANICREILTNAVFERLKFLK